MKPDVLEEHMASIFMVEQEAKQNESKYSILSLNCMASQLRRLHYFTSLHFTSNEILYAGRNAIFPP
jgi:hypothetical protein